MENRNEGLGGILQRDPSRAIAAERAKATCLHGSAEPQILAYGGRQNRAAGRFIVVKTIIPTFTLPSTPSLSK